MSHPANLAVGGVSRKDFPSLEEVVRPFFPRAVSSCKQLVFRCYPIQRWESKLLKRKQNLLLKLRLLVFLALYSILFKDSFGLK